MTLKKQLGPRRLLQPPYLYSATPRSPQLLIRSQRPPNRGDIESGCFKSHLFSVPSIKYNSRRTKLRLGRYRGLENDLLLRFEEKGLLCSRDILIHLRGRRNIHEDADGVGSIVRDVEVKSTHL